MSDPNLAGWPTPRCRIKHSQIPRLRTEHIRFHSYSSHLGRLAYSQMQGQVLSNTPPGNIMYQLSFIVRHLGRLAYSEMKGQVLSRFLHL